MRGLPEGMPVEDFWAAARAEGTPLVEPDPLGGPGHRAVPFLWRGAPGTRAVRVLPDKLVDPGDPDGTFTGRVPGTDVWHWSVRMRADWRAGYAFRVRDGAGTGEPRSGHPQLPLAARALGR